MKLEIAFAAVWVFSLLAFAFIFVRPYLKRRKNRIAGKSIFESGDAMCKFVGDGAARFFHVPFDICTPFATFDVYVDGKRYINGHIFSRIENKPGLVHYNPHIVFDTPPKKGAKIIIVRRSIPPRESWNKLHTEIEYPSSTITEKEIK